MAFASQVIPAGYQLRPEDLRVWDRPAEKLLACKQGCLSSKVWMEQGRWRACSWSQAAGDLPVATIPTCWLCGLNQRLGFSEAQLSL